VWGRSKKYARRISPALGVKITSVAKEPTKGDEARALRVEGPDRVVQVGPARLNHEPRTE
jgi:hypothetical protein